MTSAAVLSRPRMPKFVGGVLRISVTVLAFAFVATQVDLEQVGTVLLSLPASSFVAAIAWVSLSIGFGTLRWRALLRAYGAPQPPSVPRLFRLYLIGLFYNSFLPGAVGGDVVRGVATREAFLGDKVKSTAGGIAVVIVGRVCGLAALLSLSLGSLLFLPAPEFRGSVWVALAGLASIALGVAVLWQAAEVADRFSGAFGRLLSLIPRLVHGRWLARALGWSVAAQMANVGAGHAIVSALAPDVTLLDSAALIPLVSASAFFPLTVSGAGVREVAFATLFGLVGVSAVKAYAASLGYWASQLVVAALGGVLTLVGSVGIDDESSR
ncbi:MAG: lysylphosphatidylglycerol synthase transmembrane domain-containing protein [Myxococcota bacterium]